MQQWLWWLCGWDYIQVGGRKQHFLKKDKFFQNKKQSIKAKKGETKRTKQRGCGMWVRCLKNDSGYAGMTCIEHEWAEFSLSGSTLFSIHFQIYVFFGQFSKLYQKYTFQELLLDQQDEVVQRTGCKVMLNVTYRSLHGHPVRILLFQQYQAF